MHEYIIHCKINNRIKMQYNRVAIQVKGRDLLIIPGIIVAVMIGYTIPWASASIFITDMIQLLIFSGTG